jgi:magnesium transporter
MRAMIRGFVKGRDGSMKSIDSLNDLAAAATIKRENLWCNFEGPDGAAMDALRNAFGLNAEALDDCLIGEQRPRIDEFDSYLFLVSYGALGPERHHHFTPRKIAAFLGKDFLITVHHEPLRSIDAVHKRCAKSTDRMMSKGSGHLLFAILDGIVDNYIIVSEKFDDRLEVLEEECFQPDVDESLLQRASVLRREVLELRRIAASQREMLLPVASGDYDYFSDTLEKDFRHVIDHLTKTIEMIDNQRELLNSLRDNYQAVIGNRMNAVMKTLTIFASLFLPLTLLAGIYGMNTPLWPDPSSAITFWLILGVMGITSVVMLTYFHLQKWF